MSQWYIARDGQQFPNAYSWENLPPMVRSGQLQPGDMIWTQGMAQWQPASSMPELFPPQSATSPQTPRPAETSYGGAGVLGYQSLGQNPTQYGGFWLRFAAAFIDGLILWGVNLLLQLIVVGLSSLGGESIEMIGTVIATLLQYVVAWLYSALQESSRYQATIGKRACGLIVTDLTGQPINFARATGRHFAEYLSALTLLIGYIMAAFSERKQALHDMIASTLVLRR